VGKFLDSAGNSVPTSCAYLDTGTEAQADYMFVSYPIPTDDCTLKNQYACKKAKTSVGANVVCPTASADFATVINNLSFKDCYYFSKSTNKKSYTDAAASCAANSGSHLVDIKTINEGYLVWNYLQGYTNAWIGFSSCQACEAGKYTTTSDTGNTACLSCPAGKYSSTTGASTSATCTACSANMKSVVGSTYCTNSILTQSVSFVLANIDATLFDALSEAAKAAISLAIREAIQIKASSDTYTIDLANIGEPDFTQVANAPATRLMTRSLAAVSSKVTVAVDFPGDPSLTTKIDGAYTDFKAAVVDGTFLALIKTQVASVASAATLFTGVTLDATTLGAEDTSPTMAPVAAAESKKKEDLALPLGLGLGLPLGIFLVVGILYYMHTNNMLGGSEGKQQVQYSSSEQHEKSGVELSSAVGPSSGSVTVNEI